MITADFVFDLILRIAERFEDEYDCCIRRWLCEEVDGEEIDFALDGEIETALNCLNIKNRVGVTSVCDATYVICVSFVVGDELYQRIIVAEEY